MTLVKELPPNITGFETSIMEGIISVQELRSPLLKDWYHITSVSTGIAYASNALMFMFHQVRIR